VTTLDTTLVIPTYLRPARLRAALEAARRQTLPFSRILVVARPEDHEARTVARESEVEVVDVHAPGVLAAMRAGADAATTPLIAFTDDDVELSARWLERCTGHLARRPTLGVVSGRDLVDEWETTPTTAVAGRLTWWGKLVGNHHRVEGGARLVDVVKGANMLWRREALQLPTDLLGEGAQVHYEIAMSARARSSGYGLLLDPSIQVRHSPGDRFDADERRRPHEQAVENAAWNYVMALTLARPSWGARLIRLVNGLLLGDRGVPGVGLAVALAVKGEREYLRRLAPSLRGQLRAERELLRGRRLAFATFGGPGPRPLTVALISPSFGTYGGVQAVMLAIATALRAEGIACSILLKPVGSAELDPSFRAVLDVSGVDWRIVPRSPSGLVRALRPYDVVHAHTPSPDVAVVGRLLGKPLGLTVYNHRHEGDRARNAKSRVAIGLAHRVWFISDFVQRTWRFGPEARKVPTVSRLPTEQPTPPADRSGFVFVARWIENKGLEELVEAYAAADIDHAAHPLSMVGDGPLRAAVLAAVRRLGVERFVTAPGFVDDATRNEIIRRSRFLVAPANTGEDLGLTPIEARHLGVPCIVSTDGGLPEAGGPSALRCTPGDVSTLIRALEVAAAMDDNTYAELAARTKRELTEYLSPISGYAGLYRELAGRRPA